MMTVLDLSAVKVKLNTRKPGEYVNTKWAKVQGNTKDFSFSFTQFFNSNHTAFSHPSNTKLVKC